MEQQHASDELSKIFLAFPSLADWLKNTNDPKATFDLWCKMLVFCDAEDVEFVVAQIITGETEPLDRYQKPDAVAFNVKTRANERRADRTNLKRRRKLKAQAGTRESSNRNAKFIGLLRDRIAVGIDYNRGAASKESLAEAERELMVEHQRLKATDDEAGPRYSCLDCLDTGSVPCLRPELVGKAVNQGVDSIADEVSSQSTCNYACSCSAGMGLRQGAQDGRYNYEPIPCYEVRKHFKALAMGPQDLPRLQQWIEEVRT